MTGIRSIPSTQKATRIIRFTTAQQQQLEPCWFARRSRSSANNESVKKSEGPKKKRGAFDGIKQATIKAEREYSVGTHQLYRSWYGAGRAVRPRAEQDDSGNQASGGI